MVNEIQLQGIIDDLNGNMASMQQTNEAMGKKLFSMQSIIDGQRDALIRLRHEIFHGGVDEINTIMDDALALTQQQTGGAV